MGLESDIYGGISRYQPGDGRYYGKMLQKFTLPHPFKTPSKHLVSDNNDCITAANHKKRDLEPFAKQA